MNLKIKDEYASILFTKNDVIEFTEEEYNNAI